jgi:hypothetical protein
VVAWLDGAPAASDALLAATSLPELPPPPQAASSMGRLNAQMRRRETVAPNVGRESIVLDMGLKDVGGCDHAFSPKHSARHGHTAASQAAGRLLNLNENDYILRFRCWQRVFAAEET